MTHLRPRVTQAGTCLLNLGCGARFHKEWNNLDFSSTDDDVIACNIIKGIPYDDALFDAVYSSHFMEHLSVDHARAVLTESFRVLKIGGILRMVLPDLEYNARLYLQALDALRKSPTAVAEEHYRWAQLNLIDQMVRKKQGGALASFLLGPHLDGAFIRTTITGPDYELFLQKVQAIEPPSQETSRSMRVVLQSNLKKLATIAMKYVGALEILKMYRNGRFQLSGEVHQWSYDSFTLTEVLKGCGFTEIRSVQPAESAIKNFSQYLLDTDSSGAIQKPNSLFVEARR